MIRGAIACYGIFNFTWEHIGGSSFSITPVESGHDFYRTYSLSCTKTIESIKNGTKGYTRVECRFSNSDRTLLRSKKVKVLPDSNPDPWLPREA